MAAKNDRLSVSSSSRSVRSRVPRVALIWLWSSSASPQRSRHSIPFLIPYSFPISLTIFLCSLWFFWVIKVIFSLFCFTYHAFLSSNTVFSLMANLFTYRNLEFFCPEWNQNLLEKERSVELVCTGKLKIIISIRMKRAILQRESENWRRMHRNWVLRILENCSRSLKIGIYAWSEWQGSDRDDK